jgi:hypothetical protein
MATYDLSWPAQGTDQDQVKDLVIYSFGPTITFLHGSVWILMVSRRNRLKLPARFISPLLVDVQSPSHTSSTTLITCSWLKLRASLLNKPRSHTSSNTLFTNLRLVLQVVYCFGLTPILLVKLRLLVLDLYYVQVYWRGLTPILLVTLRLLIYD